MRFLRPSSSPRTQTDLVKAMRLSMWAVPALMAITGIAYTLFEHGRHRGEPGWPWMTWLGILVLGLLGPALSWAVLHWAGRVAGAYLASQEKLGRRVEELATLNRLSFEASRSLDLDKTIAAILEQTMDSLEAAAGLVFIQENGNSGLRLEAHRGVSVNMIQQEGHLKPGHCLCGQAVQNRQVLYARDVGEDPRCTSNLCICEGFRSVACAPLEAKGQLIGLLQLASPTVGHFTQDQNDFLSAAATQVSFAIENARLYDTVRAFNLELERKVNQRTRELEAARWALAEKARQLQLLLSQSYRIQEDTQSRIASDMHDGVTQIVIGALYELQAARQALFDDPEIALQSLALAQNHLSQVEVEMKRVIYDLHPPVLDMMGLTVALKRYADTYSATFHVDCRIQTTGKVCRLPKEIEIALYRIIQAAMQNVAAHAQATYVQLTFDFGSERLLVRIEDDGVGFEPEGVIRLPGEHLGLIGMKERAESIGASLQIDSQPGGGTRVELKLPASAYLEEKSI